MGRAARQRICPALGGSITPDACATGRLRTIDCPESCSHHAFSPGRYDDFLELESRLDGLLTERLMEEPGGRRLLMDGLPRFADPEVDMSDEDEEKLIARLNWLVFGERDQSGTTRAGRWLAELRPRLDSDGQILLERMIAMVPALFEVRQVLDEQTVEAIDLLDREPRPVRLRDRGLAQAATRFLPIVCWTYAAPFVRRLHGINAIFPVMSPFEPRDILIEITRHLGGPTEGPELRAWVGENLGRLIESVAHIDEARRRESLRKMDTVHSTVTYRLLRPLAECLEVLDAAPDVAEETPTWEDYEERVVALRVILAEARAASPTDSSSPVQASQTDSPESTTAPGTAANPAIVAPFGEEVLGQVRFRRRACRVTVMGAARMARLRARLEGLLGDRIEVIRVRERDLAKSLNRDAFTPDPALVPPPLVSVAQPMVLSSTRIPAQPFADEGLSPDEIRARMLVVQDRLWIDQPVPALDGHTPRDAANDPSLRPRLIHLLKSRIRQLDADNHRTSRRVPDLDWMLRELGTEEILFPQPPFRRGTAEADDL